MPSIGTVAVDSFPPQLFDAVGEYRIIRRPAVDDVAVLVDAYRAQPVSGSFQTTLGVDADPWQKIEEIQAQQFQRVTVIDGLGWQWTCRVLLSRAAPAVDVEGRTVIKSDYILLPLSA